MISRKKILNGIKGVFNKVPSSQSLKYMYIDVKFKYILWKLVEYFNRWVVDTSLYGGKSYLSYKQFILLPCIHTMNRNVW